MLHMVNDNSTLGSHERLLKSDSGAGALASPLVSTQFAQLHRWSFHYLVSLAIAISNTIILMVVFRFKDQDGTVDFTECRIVCP